MWILLILSENCISYMQAAVSNLTPETIFI